jgi:hypothetical protein
MTKPQPPRPTLRQISETVRLSTPAKLPRVPVPGPDVFAGDEEKTEPQGRIYIDRLVLKLFHDCAPEDQAYVLKTLEGYAARNAKT